MNNKKYSDAITEVLYYLSGINKNEVDKIPKKLMEYFHSNANKDYVPKFDNTKPLSELELADETKALIGIIWMNYICEDENQKKKILEKLNENQKKYQKDLNIKYNMDNLFQKKIKNCKSNLPLEIKKKNLFERLISLLKRFFKF